jgi:glycine cleavage system H protein
MYPTELKYTKDHEWVRLSGAEAQVGRRVKQGEVFGTIESVKAVSELFSPLSGEVVAVNGDLGTHPERVNTAPHDAWMIKIRPNAAAEAAGLLDATAYTALVS